MKKWLWMVALCMFLTGCGAEETLETVADEWVQPVMATPREVDLRLPEGAVAPVLESDSEQVYLSEDYEILVQTLTAGDLDATIRSISGYAQEELTVMQTQYQAVSRYEFVWVSAGEEGDRLGRAVVLDDGNYHYCLSVLWDADMEKSQIVWSDVFASFTLI